MKSCQAEVDACPAAMPATKSPCCNLLLLQDIERLASGLPSLSLDRLSSGLGSMHMVRCRFFGQLLGHAVAVGMQALWLDCSSWLPPPLRTHAAAFTLPCGLHTSVWYLPALQVAISPIGSPDNPDLASLASGSLSPHAAAVASAAAGATATFSLVPLPPGDANGLNGLGK